MQTEAVTRCRFAMANSAMANSAFAEAVLHLAETRPHLLFKADAAEPAATAAAA